MELLAGDGVRIRTGAEYQRVAVDVSADLRNWLQLTNAAAIAGEITFVNDAQQADPARFFRAADGDDTVAIAGYVDGGQYFGGIADATVTENLTGTSVKTDANGFFHFNQRFARNQLPVTVTATAELRQPAQRIIRKTDASTFSVLQMPTGEPGSLTSLVDQTYQFKVTGGPRAGLQYSIRINDGRAEVAGGLTGEGTFQAAVTGDAPYRYLFNIGGAGTIASEILFWPLPAEGNLHSAFFAGIPSTNGTLSGNGIVTWEVTPVQPINPPTKIMFVVGPGAGIIEGTVINVTFSGGTSGTFTAQNSQGDDMGRGAYTFEQIGAGTAHLRLTYVDFAGDYDDVTLTFKAPPSSQEPSAFSGTQLISTAMYPYSGTFTYQ